MATTYNQFKVSGSVFEIDRRFKPIKPIGTGAYGVVISALDTTTNKNVAIKKIARAFDDAVDAKRILREIKLLRRFHHENVINIVDILIPPNLEEFEDVYIVQDLMETDLHRIISSRQPLTIEHAQYFIYQTLRALKYIHSANVLHRDLKPSNLLVNSNCDLKICDFGLARPVEVNSGPLTEYVVTRWYRAPEIMLSCQEYTKAIDVWSVGCIFAELLKRTPLFPGEDYMHQLRLICELLGKPKAEDLDFVNTERARKYMMSLEEPARPKIETYFRGHHPDALDLLEKMLKFHPAQRITVDEALAHPFMASLHNADDEPEANFHFAFEFEDQELSSDQVRELIYAEMRDFHPELPETLPLKTTPRRRSSRAEPVTPSSESKAKERGSSPPAEKKQATATRESKSSK